MRQKINHSECAMHIYIHLKSTAETFKPCKSNLPYLFSIFHLIFFSCIPSETNSRIQGYGLQLGPFTRHNEHLWATIDSTKYECFIKALSLTTNFPSWYWHTHMTGLHPISNNHANPKPRSCRIWRPCRFPSFLIEVKSRLHLSVPKRSRRSIFKVIQKCSTFLGWTRCGLVTPYGDIELGQHRLR